MCALIQSISSVLSVLCKSDFGFTNEFETYFLPGISKNAVASAPAPVVLL